MKILKQLGLILFFGFAGEMIAALLPFAMPSSVIGLLCMLIALRTGLLRQVWIGDVADFLSANMAFFFLPSAVNIISTYHLFSGVLLQLIIICTVSTLLTFGATYLVTSGLRKWMAGRCA